MISDVVCRHSSTVNIDFMSTYVLAIQLFSLLLTGICSLLPTELLLKQEVIPNSLVKERCRLFTEGSCNDITSPCAMAEKATTG